MSTLAARRTNLLGLVRSGQPPSRVPGGYHAVMWPDTREVTETRVREAYAQLEDGKRRFDAEAFWFQSEGDTDSAFRELRSGNYLAARSAWQARSSATNGYESYVARWNLAVLQHGLTIAKEAKEIGGHSSGRSRRGLTKEWNRCFSLWSDVLADENSLRRLQDAAKRVGDPLPAKIVETLHPREFSVEGGEVSGS